MQIHKKQFESEVRTLEVGLNAPALQMAETTVGDNPLVIDYYSEYNIYN